jgi:hypothetical protein
MPNPMPQRLIVAVNLQLTSCRDLSSDHDGASYDEQQSWPGPGAAEARQDLGEQTGARPARRSRRPSLGDATDEPVIGAEAEQAAVDALRGEGAF